MKKLYLFLISILFGVSLYSQSKGCFNMLLSSIPGTSTVRCIVPADSVYFLVIDNIEPNNTQQNTIYLVIDEFGNILDSAQYKDSLITLSAVFPGNTAIKTHNGGFVIATTRTDTSKRDFGYLVRLNSTLDTLWTRTFTHPDTLAASQPGARVFCVLTAVRQTWDGGFILAGNYNKNCISGNIRCFLIKTDSLGDMEWVKLYNNVSYVYNLEITSDSGFAFTDFSQSGYLFLNKTNKSGELLFKVSPNSDIHMISGSVQISIDDCFIIMAPYVYYNPDPYIYNYGVDIAKFSKTGQLMWNKKHFLYLSFECQTLHQSSELKILPDGSIIVCGTSQVWEPGVTTGAEYKGVMMKLSADGDSLWARYYGYGDFRDVCQFNDYCMTNDGGFMAVGYYFQLYPSPQNSKAWIVKMDSNGFYNVGMQQLQHSNTELQIYPNPATDYLTLQTKDNSPLPQGRLQIFNMQGALQMEQTIPKHQNQLQLNLSHLPAGLYLGRIVSSSGEGGGFRFVKE